MEIPYDEWELRIALISLIGDEKKFTEKKFREIEDKLKGKISADKEDLNKKIAEYHDVTIEQLINSPNYKVLCGEYIFSLYKKIAEKFVEKFKITDKQAWAIIASSIGLLEL